MTIDLHTARWLYRKLLTLYPQSFRERLGESMEQTFSDLCNEQKRQSRGMSGFLLRTFFETGLGIVQEYFLLSKEMNPMQKALTNFSLSAFLSFLLILPFTIMEIVNRRNFNEDFPFMLFFGLWLNLFAISLILLPILSARRTANLDRMNPVPPQGNTRLANPNSATMMSVALVLFFVIVFLLASAWAPLQRLLNGPNPEQLHVYGVQVSSQLIALVLFSLPVVAGIMAGLPIIKTLQAGGSPFAHPINLIIVVLIASTLAVGLASLIIDQWPCFIGVPNCD